jgi:multiple sugar transport system permease protein
MRRFSNGWLAPAWPLIFGFLLFYIVPFGYSAYYAVLDNAVSRAFIGLKNFTAVWYNRFFALSVRNSLIFLAADIPTLLCVSLGLALYVYRHHARNSFFHAALLLPLLLPSAAVTPVFGKLSVFTAASFTVHELFIWKYCGLFMLIFLSAQRTVPKEYYDAAALDGAKAFGLFTRITLPLIAPAVGFAAVMVAAFNLRNFKEVYLMYGAYPDESVYLTQHFMNNQFSKLNYPLLTASGLLFALLLMLIILAVMVVVRVRSSDDET